MLISSPRLAARLSQHKPPPEPVAPAAPPAPAAPDPVDLYLQELEDQRYAPKTIRNYKLDLRLAERHLGKPVLAATPADLTTYLGMLSRQGLKASTIERKLIALKNIYKWALEQEPPLLEVNPARKLRPPKKEIRNHVFLSPEEIVRVMAVLPEDTPIHRREAAMVKCLYYAGMRASEVVGLDIDDVRDTYIRVIGKGNKERNVPLPEELARAIALWLEVHPTGKGPLFTSLGSNPSRLSYDRLRGIVNRTIRAAGLPRKYTAHKFRHSMATRLLRKGMRLEHIQKILGHSSIVTTQIYAKAELEPDISDVVGRML